MPIIISSYAGERKCSSLLAKASWPQISGAELARLGSCFGPQLNGTRYISRHYLPLVEDMRFLEHEKGKTQIEKGRGQAAGSFGSRQHATECHSPHQFKPLESTPACQAAVRVEALMVAHSWALQTKKPAAWLQGPFFRINSMQGLNLASHGHHHTPILGRSNVESGRCSILMLSRKSGNLVFTANYNILQLAPSTPQTWYDFCTREGNIIYKCKQKKRKETRYAHTV